MEDKSELSNSELSKADAQDKEGTTEHWNSIQMKFLETTLSTKEGVWKSLAPLSSWHFDFDISENKWFLQHLPLWLGTNEIVLAERTFKKINQKDFSIRKNCHPIQTENNLNFQYRI